MDATQTYNSLVQSASFVNAFTFDPTKRTGLDMGPSLLQAGIYNNALQFLSVNKDNELDSVLTPEILTDATKRCALIHNVYQLVAGGVSYSELVDKALKSIVFDDLKSTQYRKSWALYREEYSFVKDHNCPRFGKGKTRSERKERTAIEALNPLVKDFAGKVNLKNPDCPIYLLEGLRDDISVDLRELYKILCVKLASGAKYSIMAPNTRVCITTTPLCPMTAYTVCNIAMIRDDQTILDPFAGSASTLLAAALIAPNARTVGVELMSDELISREKIRRDFSTRGLKEPLEVLEGDAMNVKIRDDARNLIGGEAFDFIITDPPYGRREAASKDLGVNSALRNLINAIKLDREAGKPLLKKGGRMIFFQPCRRGQNIHDLLPISPELKVAGLHLQYTKEQRLNDGLSRWLLSFLSV